MNRSEYIREARLRQPLAELTRKANKARGRINLYSQEEIDLAEVEARELVAWLGMMERDR